MIAQPDAAQPISTPSARRSWREICARAAQQVWDVLRAPPLPWANLAEAQLFLRMIAGSLQDDSYPPDPFSSEAPFVKDNWPHDLP